ncbi:pyrroline-5-carboxylate reductase [Erysipelothrix aquatica]|uniref:pyrroline-5-carboxylate reductase n=1 Tax=Erysipelothrix aquatica TaxID=2683714 RepID=UPI00135BDEBC|nr:pyrroline-5-carboxylate reductase [Erysipelothrix aquatica]
MKIGFIGIGNMAQAIIHGMPNKEDIIISARTHDDTLFKANKLNVTPAANHHMLVIESDIIVMSVKPEMFNAIFEEIGPYLRGKTIVSIAAKLTIEKIQKQVGDIPVIRAMPNLNVAIQQGITAITASDNVDSQVATYVREMFDNLGSTVLIHESQMSGFIGLAGSSPAFVFKFIDAMVSEAMQEGFAYDDALSIASHAVSGSANYLRVSGVDAQILTERVCSPGGTTIEGVRSLDANHFEDTVRKAVRATINKDKQ